MECKLDVNILNVGVYVKKVWMTRTFMDKQLAIASLVPHRVMTTPQNMFATEVTKKLVLKYQSTFFFFFFFFAVWP